MYLKVNDVDLWYDKTGSGPSVILLHGNSESSHIFGVLSGQLKDRFTVYTLDSRCHGKSSNPAEISYELMAEDVAAFIRLLELEQPVLYGFSDGGVVGLLLASKYPALLGKLIVSGANTHPGATKKFWQIIFHIIYFFSRDKRMRMMFYEPHIKKEDLSKICIPVLVLAGENDMIRETDTKFIAESIPHSVLKIIPKENHMSYVINSPKLYEHIEPFLA